MENLSLLIYLGIIVIGLGVAAWLFLQDNTKKDSKKPSPSLLERLGLDENGIPHGGALKKAASVKEPPPAPEEVTSISGPLPTIISEREQTAKIDKLEALLREKGEELDKKERDLENELKNRKEFNKVKDILEKELKDSKDKGHKLQLDLSAFQAEVENYKKRIEQLEEKLKSKEQTVFQKEKEIDDLVKKLKAFAAQPPVVQAPPASKEIVAQEKPPQPEAQAQTPPPPEPVKESKTEETPPTEQPTTKPESPKTEEKPKEQKFVQGEPIRQPPHKPEG